MKGEKNLDALINNTLDSELACADLPNVCDRLTSATGRKKIFDRVKNLILMEGITDVNSALVHIENEIDMNK